MAEKTVGVNQALFEIPASGFYSKIGLFQGDMVTVSLYPTSHYSEHSKTIRLVPRALLFYYSKFCEEKARLSPIGSESDGEPIHIGGGLFHIRQKDDPSKPVGIDLLSIKTEAFDMALQWMYTGNVIPDIDSSKPFGEVQSYIQFFIAAEMLQLPGPFMIVEQKLKDALIAARKKEYENKLPLTCNPVFKEMLRFVFVETTSSKNILRELLASFFVESYAKHLFCPDMTTTANHFKDLFKSIDGLELEVLRLVGSSLEGMSLGRPKSDGFSAVRLLCPLTEEDFKTEMMLKAKPGAPKPSSKLVLGS
ncbi:hypothetical protein NHQ30_000164 [Ciborinia camelliae]|nr:hypothetical protein NHQ30_000164 [Ciborinia camelliae]